MTAGRRTLTFTWDAVDETVIRHLLRAAYADRGQEEEIVKVASLPADQLRRNADRVLGRPPKKRLRRGLTDVLREAWLPRADGESLKDLVGLMNRFDPLSNRQERIAFLKARRRTEAFVEVLWKAFISAHKRPSTTRPGSSSSSAPGRSLVPLVGAGSEPLQVPYDHQRKAWDALDRLRAAGGRRSGLMVIPTGGGKTSTMVIWLVKEMPRRHDLKVLWIADQQELVDQAVREFTVRAKEAPTGFERRLRAVHSGAGAVSALADPNVQVVCTTRQSLVGRGFDRRSKGYLEAFMTGPTVVVVDEAHHAVSPTYQRLLDYVWEIGRGVMLVGLTATPWPAGAGQTQRLRDTFPTTLVSVTTGDLVTRGDLARPVVHTVETAVRVEVTDDDLRRLSSGREVPSRIARQLDRTSRNGLVVQQWLQGSDWGKTLVFACDIHHADSLGAAFEEAGVTVEVLHSQANADRAEVLERFRAATEPRVLVSVGMLLEGVDLPSARTAFLCRPTSSRIAMRQMIGRVLRGVHAGGDPEAHIVDFVDQWSQHGGLLSPVDIPDVPSSPAGATGDGSERPLPPIIADDGAGEIGEDLIRSIAQAIADRVRIDGINATLTSSRLIGFYDLDVLRIPVFEAAHQAWEDAAAWALSKSDRRGTSALTLFDSVPPPAPLNNEIAAFVDHCQSHGLAPALVPLVSSVDVAATARGLIAAGAMTANERIEFLRTSWEGSLARSLYPTLQLFIEAVGQAELAQLNVIASGSSPESIDSAASAPTQTLRAAQRELVPLVSQVLAAGRELLVYEGTYEGWLDLDLPAVDWTPKPISSAWAYWSWRKGTRARDKPVIWVNRALRAPRTQVPDDLLQYLIWHELCHHLTPGQGHNAEFMRLECLWPDHARLDHELDTLHERYAMPGNRAKTTK